MLIKNEPFQIDPFDPFKGDALGRDVIAMQYIKLIQSTSQAFVMSIESPWGTGKTTLIRMMKAQLELDGHFCALLNAWKTDFADDPLMALMGEIKSLEPNIKDLKKYEIIWNKLMKLSGAVVKTTLPLAIQLASSGLLNAKETKGFLEGIFGSTKSISDFASDFAEEKIAEFDSSKQTIEDFRSTLEELAKTIIAEGFRPLVIFIDELDRCNPDYAIALLERMKHLFDVNGIVFVIAVDSTQLANIVYSRYGIKMKTDGYLRKFIDYRFQLPTPNAEEFGKYLYNKYELGDHFQTDPNNSHLYNSFVHFSDFFQLSLRVQEQSMTEINMVLQTHMYANDPITSLVAFLVLLRAFDSDTFESIRNRTNNMNAHSKVLAHLETLSPVEKQINNNPVWGYIRAYFWLRSGTEGSTNRRIGQLVGINPRSVEEQNELNLLRHGLENKKFDDVDNLFKILELTQSVSRTEEEFK